MRNPLNLLLVLIPAALLGRFLHWPPLAIFIIGSSLYACAALLMLSGVFRARPKVM